MSPPGRRWPSWGQWGVPPLICELMAPGVQLLSSDLYPMGIPALHLSPLSLRETPQRAFQHRSLLTGVRPIHALQDRVFTSSLTSSAPHPSDLPRCPLQGASPSPSPKAQAAAFQCLQWCLLSLSLDVATGSERLNLLPHNRLSNSVLFHIFFPF